MTSNVEEPPSNNGESQISKDAGETASIGRSSIQTLQNPEPENTASSQKSYLQDLAHDRRNSSQSARPALRDLERSYVAKVRRGPRPSVDFQGRPRTAGGTPRNHDQRPVASLPSTVRMPSRHSHTPDYSSRPRSQPGSGATMPDRETPPVPPLLLIPPPVMTGISSRPQRSPATKSMSAVSTSGLTPEKERLMKALHLRRKQMEKQAEGKKKQSQGKHDDNNNNNNNNANNHKTNDNKIIMPSSQQDRGNLSGQGQENLARHPAREPGEEHRFSATQNNEQQQPSLPPPPSAPASVGPNEEQKPVFPEPPRKNSNIMDETKAVPELKEDQLPTDPVTNGVSTPVESSAIPPSTQDDSKIAAPEKDSTDAGHGDTNEEPHFPHDSQQTDNVSPEPHSEVAPETSPETSPEKEEIASLPQTENAPLTSEPKEEAKNESSEPPLSEEPEEPSHQSETPADDKESAPAADEAPTGPTLETSEETRKDVDTQQEKKDTGIEREVNTPTEISDDDNVRSDDSVVEELRSSKVEEARQVAIPKALPEDYVPVDTSKNSRTVSSPTSETAPSKMQTLSIGRSVSSPYSENRPVSPVPMAKKINVSSGISRRIKALEKFSQSPAPPTTLNIPSATFESVGKRNPSLTTAHSEATTNSRPSSFVTASSTNNSRAPSRSASVTALKANEPSEQSLHRIQPNLSAADPVETDVSSHRQSPTASPPAPTPDKSKGSSLSTALPRHEPPASPVPRPESVLSSASTQASSQTNSTNDPSQSPEEKKESRTSRLFRRMSSMRPTPRKSAVNTLSPSQEENNIAPREKSSPSPPKATGVPQAVDIGEVNIQFPDTLLWKRRFMRIDEKGCLVLAPANKDFAVRNMNMTKRYPLSDFKTPSLPDEDRQELPNSIVLDFLDGSTLQCACESKQGQNAVLQSKFILYFQREQEDANLSNSSCECT